MKAPISVCMIVKNEEKNLPHCLRSIRPYVEQIVIIDTGSTDKTLKVAKQFTSDIYSYDDCNDANGNILSFSEARNASFQHANCDWAMWLDADDVVLNADQLPYLCRFNDSKSRAIYLTYNNCGQIAYRERIVSWPGDFFWHGDVHEVLLCRNDNVESTKNNTVKIVHTKKKVNSGSRNLRILLNSYTLYNKEPRTLFYLALEYYNSKDYKNALRYFSEYLQVATWDEEIAFAHMYMSDCYLYSKEYFLAISSAQLAIEVKDKWAECWLRLAKALTHLQMYDKAKDAAIQAKACPATDTMLFKDSNIQLHVESLLKTMKDN